MNYGKFLSRFMKKDECPFCSPQKDFIITENKSAYLTPARAPYLKDHLLVIPKRHVVMLNSLKNVEEKDIFNLLISGIKVLRKKYPAVDVDYREGDMSISGKSVSHLHFHLVPKKGGSRPDETPLRKFLSERSLIKEVERIKKIW